MYKKNNHSIFRKLAASLWHEQGDPSVYGFIELDVTELEGASSKLLAMVTKALGDTMANNNELRTMIRWGRISSREDHCISIMVNIPDDKKDLSVLNIQNADQLNLTEIQEQIEHKAHFIRKREDPHLGPILFLISLLPLVPLARPALMVSLGKIDAEVKPFQGRIEIRQIAHLGITFDHRLFDGSHAAKMLNDFEKSFQSLKMT